MKHNLKPGLAVTHNTRVQEELDVMKHHYLKPPRTLVNLGLTELTLMPCSHLMTDITSLFQITRYLPDMIALQIALNMS